MLPWELRCVLGGNWSQSGIIILYSTSEQGYLVLALYKHALLYILIMTKLISLNSLIFLGIFQVIFGKPLCDPFNQSSV